MTLEVRQLVMRSTIGGEAEQEGSAAADKRKPKSACEGDECCGESEERAQMKAEILGECRRVLMEQLRQLRER
jgi:hypothetical protein